MLTLNGNALTLSMSDEGIDVILEDRARGQRWRLDESTRLAAHDVPRDEMRLFGNRARDEDRKNVTFIGKGKLIEQKERLLRFRHETSAGTVTIRWEMQDERLLIRVEASDPKAASSLSLPGTFYPVESPSYQAAIPRYQGILHHGKGPDFQHHFRICGGACTMSMFGQIAGRGALTVISETDADCFLHWEKLGTRPIQLMWVQSPSHDRLAYDREVVIQAAAPSVTSICKTYRRYEIEKERFKTWDEKIAERPHLEKFFGAATVFTGYHHDPELDYADSFRRLKKAGIDRAYVYPAYMDSTLDTSNKMGVSHSDYRDLKPVFDELGYLAGSFIYMVDGPKGTAEEDARNLAWTRDKKPRCFWRIDELEWWILSLDKQWELAKKYIDEGHTNLDAVHFDVLCSRSPREDYHPEHKDDALKALEIQKKILSYSAEQGLLVSSEGFWGRMTPYYDFGSSKLAHAVCNDEYSVIPMTMLVYHDSASHIWWEVDNYNNPEHRTQNGRGYKRQYRQGGGFPKLQSAWDALMGTPPDIFPFGLQYNFVPHNKPDFYLYSNRLEDPFVQEAIACAKPVMALHKRIGKLEMTDLILHRNDGSLQETVFADGTRVVANFSNTSLEVPGAGMLPAESWKEITS